jgi:hypothetical protein
MLPENVAKKFEALVEPSVFELQPENRVIDMNKMTMEEAEFLAKARPNYLKPIEKKEAKDK